MEISIHKNKTMVMSNKAKITNQILEQVKSLSANIIKGKSNKIR